MLETIWNFIKPMVSKALGMAVAAVCLLLAEKIPGFDIGVSSQEALVAFIIGLIGVFATHKTTQVVNPANAATPELIEKGKIDQTQIKTAEHRWFANASRT